MSQGTNPSYSYSRGHRIVEIVAITTVFTMLAWSVFRGLTVAARTGWWGWLGLAVFSLLGYMAADLVSGLVHWGGDTIGDANVPFLGKNFIGPFREHHVDPKGITRHDFIETNGNNCVVVAAPLSAGLFLMPDQMNWRFALCTIVCSLSLFTVATNQFHKWAHADSAPVWVRALQNAGLILSPKHHNIHHTKPHDSHYCITAGWMNPLLNKLHFFRGLEGIVRVMNPSLLHIEERIAFTAERERASRARS